MRIYFNGCSHTIGSPQAIPAWREQSYPALIAKELGLSLEGQLAKEITDADVHVSAYRGGSNERIYRKTMQDCIQNNFNYDIAVIQWTHIDRFETPQKTKHKWHKPWMDPEGWMQHKPGSSLYDTRDETFIPDRGFYRRHHGGVDTRNADYMNKMSRKLCSQIMGLNYFLANHNIRTLNITCQAIRGKMGQYCFNNFEWSFDPMHYWCEELLLSYGFLRQGEFAEGPHDEFDGHFKPDAHEFIAEGILKQINGSNKIMGLNTEGWNRYRLLYNEWFDRYMKPAKPSEIYEEDWD